MKKIFAVMALVICISSILQICFAADKKGQKYFEAIFSRVHQAVVEENYDDMQILILPANKPTGKMKKESFMEDKLFLLDVYPDLSQVRILRYEESTDKALLVMQTHLTDENYISVDVYEFILTNEGWKISGGIFGESIQKGKKPEDNLNIINKALNTNPKFKLVAPQ